MRKIWTILLCISMLASCIKVVNEPEPEEASYPEGATVTIPFTVTGETLSNPFTKNVGLGEDTPINSLHVAVFGGSGYLKEYVKAQNLTRIEDYTYTDIYGMQRTVAQYSFSVTLTMSESRRIIHFIGNGPSTLSFGYADAVLSSLLSETGTRCYWQTKTVSGIRAKKSTVEEPYIDGNGNQVFYGDYIDINHNKIVDGTGYIPDEQTANALSNIPLVKNWGKIRLAYAEDSNFTPYSYAIINVPSKGTIAPYCEEMGFVSNYQNYTIEALNAAGYVANLPVGTPFDNSVPSIDDFQNFTNGVASFANHDALYLYERPVPTSQIEPSAIIVYGHYYNADDPENEGDYYYKIDLMEGNQYYPILRNFEYEVYITSVLSQGQHNPVAAAASAGSADVSADINASHLADISDGTARLVISPWMAHTYISKVNDGTLSAFFVDDVNSWNINMDVSAVSVEKLPMSSGGADVIETLTIDPPINDIEESMGWRTVHFTTSDPGVIARTQTIRVTGEYEGGYLYRDIEVTLLPVQPMKVRCAKRRISNTKGTYQCVEIVIPEGLTDSMFPLEFWIEPESMTLTPDPTKVNNSLPVAPGASISEKAEVNGKESFHYLRTLTWNEYRTLTTERDENNNTWRILQCHFKSNCDDSATTVWVQNEYFLPAHASFTVFRDMTFRNFGFTTPIKREEYSTVTVHFDVDTDPTFNYPEDFPVITMEAFQMEPISDNIAPVQGSPGTYTFKPDAASVDLIFRTTTDSGELELELSADEYDSQSLRSHFFQGFGFVNGHKMWKSSSYWSNVACGHINYDKNKTILFGYYDDPEAPNIEIDVKDMVGLQLRNPTSYPYTPTGPRSDSGVQTYHELEFTTPNAYNLDPVTFTLSAKGYVEEYVRVGRFQGNILTQDQITTATVLNPNNSYGFSEDNPSFTMVQNPNQAPKFTLSFDKISHLNSSAPQGLILNAGDTYTITLTSNTADYYMFYLQFNVRTGYSWNGVKRTLAPVSGIPSVGDFYLYPGDNKQFIWNLPQGTTTATLTLTASDDYPINITEMVVKSYRASFHD